jgi:hypothetical protein
MATQSTLGLPSRSASASNIQPSSTQFMESSSEKILSQISTGVSSSSQISSAAMTSSQPFTEILTGQLQRQVFKPQIYRPWDRLRQIWCHRCRQADRLRGFPQQVWLLPHLSRNLLVKDHEVQVSRLQVYRRQQADSNPRFIDNHDCLAIPYRIF